MSGLPQLVVGPHDSSSLILDNSIFSTGRITLTNSTIGLSITGTTSDTSLITQGGIGVSGSINSYSTRDVSVIGGITGALVLSGGAYIDKQLIVNNNISVLTGDLTIGSIGNFASLYIGTQGTYPSFKITRNTDNRLRFYSYSTLSSSYVMLMMLEDFT
jgi:hypothetical protein